MKVSLEKEDLGVSSRDGSISRPFVLQNPAMEWLLQSRDSYPMDLMVRAIRNGL